MKEIIYVIGLSMFLLAACANGGEIDPSNTSGGGKGGSGGSDTSETSSGDESSSSEDEPEVEIEVKDGPILHAWGWTTERVKNSLTEIKNAGYKNVQLSPLQPSKDKNGNAYWWNIYQPQGFVVATGNDNPLGNKDSLKELTKAAEKEGINIIMDVITNHLGGPNWDAFDSSVQHFEPTIYNNNLKHNNGIVQNWNDRRQVATRAMGGYPDVITADSRVQTRIISMLKEYIDCGVKGFRFDAAKSIETPDDDQEYRSDYWPNVTKAIHEYGEQKLGIEPYIYGEILDNPCIQYEAYTKYMSITDNRQGSDVLFGVKDKNAGKAASAYYNAGSAEKSLLWAESHDTYANANGHSYDIDENIINLTYAIQIARKDATALFFARPQTKYEKDKAPQVIPASRTDYKAPLVVAANKLHNDFVGGTETISTSNSAVVNVRKLNSKEGALIADVNCGDNNITVNVNALSNGKYVDLITNKTYTVSNGSVSVKLTKGACVLEKETGQSGPSITIEPDRTVFADSTNVSISVKNGTNSSYKINNGSAVSFNNSTTVQVGSALSDGEIKITVTSSNSGGENTSSVTVLKTVHANKDIVVTNVPTDIKLGIWNWSGQDDGEWIAVDGTSAIRGVNLKSNKSNYIVATFDSGDALDWNNRIGKTADLVKTETPVVLNYTDYFE